MHELPQEIKDALASDPKASKIFTAISPSHQKEYLDWILEAKKSETKHNRIQKMLKMLKDSD